ncbi:hypothetical protein ERO13_D02G127801v2 [Gossypium hirsutum]|uniref:Uncharacterized protein n=4 Tax=Gossypium TaxID=3633 RepID=A0A0D2SGX2_GOSRA|nr:hypothetical protein ERO13_D02G127801v2 [Gossypium hirsutum]KJB30440.1 hypothetical protein B456_005G143600 [Gossypium raimondii]TYH83897.1 hypothetical protein ES332_D02G162800v1 [Gossypium tomentosum]
MAISGNLSVAATLASYHHNPSPSSTLSSKVDFTCFMNGRSSFSGITLKWTGMTMNGRNIHDQTKGLAGILGGYKISPNTGSQEVESILLNAINMSFFERLNLAWKIVFPSPATRRISDEAKQKIVKNIVRTPSDFVEMESKDKVQLSVSTDSDLGTIYSVTVPVQRVKAEYQEVNGAGTITNIEYKDTGERSGCIDVKFDFYVPDE